MFILKYLLKLSHQSQKSIINRTLAGRKTSNSKHLRHFQTVTNKTGTRANKCIVV